VRLYDLLKPLLFKIDPETIHHISCSLGNLSAGIIRNLFQYENERLKTKLFDLELKNPVGLAAGFDKNGKLSSLMSALGFGFMEVGSVTFRPSQGNPKPRLFRLPRDEALINRLGLNNEGASAILNRLKKISQIPFGINIAKTNDAELIGEEAQEDFISAYEVVKEVGGFHILNVSCPNTEDGKTFENPASLEALLSRLNRSKIPLLIKFAPDLDEGVLKENISVCESKDINGYVLSNTSSKREDLTEDPVYVGSIGKGGLSGVPLFKKLPTRVEFVRSIISRDKPIIAVGGIDSGDKVFQLLRAGASCVELYTGLVYKGPSIVKEINMELIRLMDQHKVERWN